MKKALLLSFLVVVQFVLKGQCIEEEFGLIWKSKDNLISLKDLAHYAAPMLWFSPDEINLSDKDNIKRLPNAFPFEINDHKKPIVYYKYRFIYESGEGEAIINEDIENKDLQILDLKYIRAIDLDFYYYFEVETGPTAHKHDIESVALQIRVIDAVECPDFRYAIKINKVTGRAHGLHWYNNVLKVDEQTFFPLSILVEEGKHASCTDKNADGTYTPTYDVTERINDAGGIRDIITSGRLVSGAWQAWMAKRREKGSIVFPPIPEDSPYFADYMSKFGEFVTQSSTYEIRPYPDYKKHKTNNQIDKSLDHFMKNKTPHLWPKRNRVSGSGKITQWIKEEKSFRSLSLAYRWDETQGLSLAFPLFLFKNIEAPKTGGWIYNKVYFGDFSNLANSSPIEFEKLLGHQITYSSSASRWIDMYIGAGYEIYDIDLDPANITYDAFFVSELGIKFRLNIGKTPLRFLRHLGTDFWGVKAGWKNIGFSPFINSGFVIELGAGVF